MPVPMHGTMRVAGYDRYGYPQFSPMPMLHQMSIPMPMPMQQEAPMMAPLHLPIPMRHYMPMPVSMSAPMPAPMPTASMPMPMPTQLEAPMMMMSRHGPLQLPNMMLMHDAAAEHGAARHPALVPPPGPASILRQSSDHPTPAHPSMWRGQH